MAHRRVSRREMMERCIERGLLVGSVSLSGTNLLALWQDGERQARKATSPEVLGPFYKKGAPSQAVLRIAGEPGFPLRVSGVVSNTRGDVVPEARVDIWQADHAGRYDVAGFRYRTKLTPDADGLYTVETILPGHYSDRPVQHIHYLISAPGHKTLITQAYFATDPYFEGDPDKNYRKGNIVENRELVRPVMLYEEPGAARAAIRFDIVLERA